MNAKIYYFLLLNMNSIDSKLKLQHERAKIKYPKMFKKKEINKLPTIPENYYTVIYFINICIENIENYIRICHIDKLGWG